MEVDTMQVNPNPVSVGSLNIGDTFVATGTEQPVYEVMSATYLMSLGLVPVAGGTLAVNLGNGVPIFYPNTTVDKVNYKASPA